MNRAILDMNGEDFENIIINHIKKQYNTVKALHSVWAYSEYLGKNTQIDIVVVTSRCLFFIEAKNWKNRIKGDYNDKIWVGRGSSQNQLSVNNVYRQNFIHIRALRNELRRAKLEPPIGINLVVLPDSALIISNCSEVIHLSELTSSINKWKVLPEKYDVEKYASAISDINKGYLIRRITEANR